MWKYSQLKVFQQFFQALTDVKFKKTVKKVVHPLYFWNKLIYVFLTNRNKIRY